MQGEMPETLTLSQCQTIGGYLGTAQRAFEEYARECRTFPGHERIAEQFDRQAEEALRFAVLFSNAEYAEVTVPEDDEGGCA